MDGVLQWKAGHEATPTTPLGDMGISRATAGTPHSLPPSPSLNPPTSKTPLKVITS